jgi:response regulator of citrate/malate metabolism
MMDVRLLGEKDGIDAALEIYPQHPCRIVYVTGSNEPSTQTKILSDHPFRTLIKPVNIDQLREALTAS